MTKDTFAEIVCAIIFCGMAVLLINPMHVWMPSMAHVTMLAIGAAAFGAFVLIVLRERGGDERDEAHRAAAGRAAFLLGSAVLLIGIASQSSGRIDPWLAYALIAMVVGKIGTRLWTARYR